MKYTTTAVAYAYAKRNLELMVSKGVDVPMATNDEVHNALRQLKHFAKQGVKVRLK